MAHAGEELRLVLARHFELAALVLDLVEQRTFSIAITAWSAKVSINAICLSVNGVTSSL